METARDTIIITRAEHDSLLKDSEILNSLLNGWASNREHFETILKDLMRSKDLIGVGFKHKPDDPNFQN